MNFRLTTKTFKLQVSVFLCSILIPMAAMAYTEHSGTVSSSETWEAGTHYVTASVTVADNQVLTIQPGALVKFAPNTQMTVNGTLRAEGAATNGR